MKYLLLFFLVFLMADVSSQNVSNKTHEEHFELPKRSFHRKVPRVLSDVPLEQFPRPGECRIWYPNRVVGEQPPPMKCEEMVGIMLQEGAFIMMYTGKAYDAEYDWKKDPNNEKAKEKSGKIPKAVIEILYGPTKS